MIKIADFDISCHPTFRVIPEYRLLYFFVFSPLIVLSGGDRGAHFLDTLHEAFIPIMSFGDPFDKSDQAFSPDHLDACVCVLMVLVVAFFIRRIASSSFNVLDGSMAFDLPEVLVRSSSLEYGYPGLFP